MRWNPSYTLTIAAMLLASQAASASESTPNIVVVVSPLKPYVEEIVQSQGVVQNLLNPQQEPHDFALSIPQGQMLAKADIVIVPDLSINPFLKRLLAKNNHAQIIELSKLEGAEPLPYDKSNPWVDAMKDAPRLGDKAHYWHKQKPPANVDANAAPRIWPTDGKKDEQPQPATADASVDVKKEEPKAIKKDEFPIDPHLWLDPERMAAIAIPLAAAMAEHYPAARVEFTANARNLATHLRHEVIPPMRELLSKPSSMVNAVGRPQIPFITYHAAYQYFLQRFKLSHTGEITSRPEETIGAATAAKMLNGAEGLHVNCIIGEEESALMVRLATLTGARKVILSPEQVPVRKDVDVRDWIHNDYDRLLYVTAKAFNSCL